ncbi:MAG TPA: type II secretion system F family protein [Candidatus Binataceae bacterium]|nr:type II secretion system F family protein [Candidatus Binataceae bacterium]
MDFVVSSAIFLVVFAIAIIVFTSREGDANANKVARRMTPLPEDNPGDVDITRQVRKPEQGLLTFLYRTNLLRTLEQSIWQAGLFMRTSEMLLIMVLMFLAGATVANMVFGDSLFAFGGGVIGASLPIFYLRFRRRRRLKAFGAQLPHALDLLRSSLEAGHSLLRGMQVVVQEFGEPLGGEFRTVLEQTRIGLPLPRALNELLKRMPEDDLRLMVVAVKVQSEVGSSLAAIIGRLSEIVRTRQRLRLQVKALTAQSRMGGMIVGLLPVIVLGAFSLIQPGYTTVLFHDPTGLKILKAAVVMDLTALLIIKRLLRVDY